MSGLSGGCEEESATCDALEKGSSKAPRQFLGAISAAKDVVLMSVLQLVCMSAAALLFSYSVWTTYETNAMDRR